MSYKPSVALHPGLTVARELDAIGETHKWLAVKRVYLKSKSPRSSAGLHQLQPKWQLNSNTPWGAQLPFGST